MYRGNADGIRGPTASNQLTTIWDYAVTMQQSVFARMRSGTFGSNSGSTARSKPMAASPCRMFGNTTRKSPFGARTLRAVLGISGTPSRPDANTCRTKNDIIVSDRTFVIAIFLIGCFWNFGRSDAAAQRAAASDLIIYTTTCNVNHFTIFAGNPKILFSPESHIPCISCHFSNYWITDTTFEQYASLSALGLDPKQTLLSRGCPLSGKRPLSARGSRPL